jgi:hypothetical protein
MRIELDPEDPACAAVLVDAQVGDDVVPFMLDTGAGRTGILRSGLIEGLEQLGVGASNGLFGTGSEQLVVVPQLRIGGAEFRDLEVGVIDHGHSAARNLLGMDVLSCHAWELRFSDQTLVREPQRSAMSSQSLTVDSKLHPYVEISFDDSVTTFAVLDSGAGVTVIDATFVCQHPWLVTMNDVTTGTDSTGSTKQIPMGMLAPSCIGGVSFESSRVAITELDSLNTADRPRADVIIGYPLLRQADWLIDIPQRRWAVIPARPN